LTTFHSPTSHVSAREAFRSLDLAFLPALAVALIACGPP
jgi:hypothetical protein